ncbi:MAG: hypothetical protein ABR526_13465 [Chthoniobacterales bacterium]
MLSASLLLPAPSAVQAATFNIADGDVAALKNAIAAANSNGADDIINLAAGGTYTLTAVDNTTSGPNGLPDTQGEEIQASGFAPPKPSESVILTTLSPASYTAIVRRVGNTVGVGLVDVYAVK